MHEGRQPRRISALPVAGVESTRVVNYPILSTALDLSDADP